ncbi:MULTISPECIES: aldehyde dehydrogenase [Listeria]|uniref:aldehyde dehydrogenase n=1 Tax=Listeria TaxID=1637 RepID=UPI000B592706|nr:MULTISPECIES: aldehyde dehydrogenase [Listeria]
MQISDIMGRQKAYFDEGHTKRFLHRKTTLENLAMLLKENEKLFLEALEKDLGKSNSEAYMTEIGIIYEEISFALKHLKKWMRVEKVKTSLTHVGSKGFIQREPYGTVLVVAPWNYPYQLALAPLIGAIAAGNTVILKPSELAPHTAQVLMHVLSRFREEIIAVVNGGVDVTTELLDQKMDYIFFTGSTHVGKIVMQKAANHLTPVTLELGGKSPLVVMNDANMKLAAKRIAFGKWVNAGQTCIAPDYVLVQDDIYDEFKAELREAITELYGGNPLMNEAYGRIVNEAHFKRLQSYVPDAFVDEANLKMAPYLLEAPDLDSPVMREEIFGPILPLIRFAETEDAIRFIRERPKPLALYLFTASRKIERKFLFKTSSGGVCINDTLMHIATPYLPFGGVGDSGTGNYHGEASFRTFSHEKSVLRQTTAFDMKFRYPNSKYREKLLRFFLK